jgi:hypothetical protein
MDLPAKVLVHCQLLNLTGTQGTLVAIRPDGAYELRLVSQGRTHTVLLPIALAAIVFAEPEAEVPMEVTIER